MYGDMGSPCLIPQVWEKKNILVPFTRIEIELVEIQFIISLVILREI